MNNRTWNWWDFPATGYITTKLSNDELSPIRQEVYEIRDRNFIDAERYNEGLAGNIKREYLLKKTKNYIGTLVEPMIYNYIEHYNYRDILQSNIKQKNLVIDSVWVNYQKKGEFNPIHMHYGTMSFVIWMDIPFLKQDEVNLTPDIPADKNEAGNFAFVYSDPLNTTKTVNIAVDKSYEGTLCVFPSSLRHCVYPFYTSDDYRITVAGNFKFGD